MSYTRIKYNGHKAFSLVEISMVILIIGILVAGIAKGVDLYQDFKISNARNITNNSRVPRIDGLALWLETTMPQSFDKNEQVINGNITNWYDLNPFSSNKINFNQTSATRKPTLRISSANNLPVLYFDGNDYLITNKIVSRYDLTKNGNVTVFVVLQIFNLFPAIILKHEIAGNNNRLNLEYNTYLRFDYPDGFSGLLAGPANSLVRDKNIIMTALFDGVNQTIFSNGVLYATKVNNIPKTQLMANIFIGAHVNLLMNPIANFSEIIIYDRALSESERTDVERYLSKKWEIKI